MTAEVGPDTPINEHPSIVRAREEDGEEFGSVVVVLPRRGESRRVAVAFGPIFDELHAHEVASAAALGGAPTFLIDLDDAGGHGPLERYSLEHQRDCIPVGQGRESDT